MDDNMKVEKWTLEDGRRAERRVTEQKDANGEGEKVVELFVEDERPLRLQQRVVEKSKPVIIERKIETVDPSTGNVVEQKTESLEPKIPLQLVDHIKVSQASAPSVVAAQAVYGEGDKPVTKQEMIDAIVAAIKANREVVHSSPVPAPTPAKMDKPPKKINSLGIAEELEKATQSSSGGMSLMDKIMIVVIAAQIIGLGYILFVM
jgi:hypothetical protein